MKGQFTVIKSLSFEAAHYLECYDGPCIETHGHTFQVEVQLFGYELDEIGMLVDFRVIKQLIKDRYDHTLLNALDVFNTAKGGINPTAENLAKDICEVLTDYFADIEGFGFNEWPSIEIDFVKVWESPDSCATFFPDS